jgi:hypothetical protein
VSLGYGVPLFTQLERLGATLQDLAYLFSDSQNRRRRASGLVLAGYSFETSTCTPNSDVPDRLGNAIENPQKTFNS